MAQPTDESKTDTLPDPELNPLLNPVLAANMGRWAEVYFTNPPEKRAQAVAELIRELEKNPPAPENYATDASPNIPSVTAEKGMEDVLLRRSRNAAELLPSEATQPSGPVCEACGHLNAKAQRFCGMCGMPLPAKENDFAPPAEQEPVRQQSWHDQGDSPRETAYEPRSTFGEPARGDYPGSSNDFPSLTPLSDRSYSDRPYDDGLFRYQAEEPPRRNYRLYIGLVLAIVLALLVYKTWRGNAGFWSNRSTPSSLPEAAPSANEAQPAAAAQPPATAQPSANTPQATTPAPEQPAPSNKAGANVTAPKETPPAETAAVSKPSPRGARLTPAATRNVSDDSSPQGGAAELAIGQKYLNGGPGTARDTHEAASWLWKAVAKKNMTATMLLSDLYLHGDGVSKSCDQARLLLDAAAKKGYAAAAERLRNMAAFGCQ